MVIIGMDDGNISLLIYRTKFKEKLLAGGCGQNTVRIPYRYGGNRTVTGYRKAARRGSTRGRKSWVSAALRNGCAIRNISAYALPLKFVTHCRLSGKFYDSAT